MSAALCTGPLGLCRGVDWERQRERRQRAVEFLQTAYLRASLAPGDYLPAAASLAASRSDEDTLPPAPLVALEADVRREAAAADRAEARAAALSLGLTGVPGAPTFRRMPADPPDPPRYSPVVVLVVALAAGGAGFFAGRRRR
jgi:hypothetical protein